ncbi:MAG: hypothetical protein TE42_05975 [Candidatus Synechococcus spongiarum SP3]|uniref:HEPN domain-containing protein n=1 Tax=Candidatus Synechococcus spongiarum SP3 TaxID=1604020 RepID=A0A0G2IW71_9SYNE|nr:MAG: hypothetical protein TE42_05975 [Candidatus Synechococcus spongiarum SP3]
MIHQVFEKSLKAWLINLGAPSPSTNDLQSLIHLLQQQNVDTTGLKEFILLNQFAAQSCHESDLDPLHLNRRFWEMRAEELVNHLSAANQ